MSRNTVHHWGPTSLRAGILVLANPLTCGFAFGDRTTSVIVMFPIVGLPSSGHQLEPELFCAMSHPKMSSENRGFSANTRRPLASRQPGGPNRLPNPYMNRAAALRPDPEAGRGYTRWGTRCIAMHAYPGAPYPRPGGSVPCTRPAPLPCPTPGVPPGRPVPPLPLHPNSGAPLPRPPARSPPAAPFLDCRGLSDTRFRTPASPEQLATPSPRPDNLQAQR